MHTIFPTRGLYAITADKHNTPEELVASVRDALRGGAAVIQYRVKTPRDRLTEARLVLDACRAAGVPLIINDDVELAAEIGADGVHLGRDDGSLAAARARLGAGAILGVSCYDSVDRAIEAEREGASYVAFGRFFPSLSKPGAPLARLETLRAARLRLNLPIVAIGGITPANGGALLEAGAGLLAVIDAVFGADDPRIAAERFLPLFALETGRRSARGA
ncbi:thiamine phosphate synthase [Methylococcus sp. EFPC2]|uniref:thiamine phosphate synthase n=1 Tax=Methylococcus sp. EFPC2 TaxID=2812648 RepID=UPI0019681A21|nr:thiamine phosphate synthase [Methylococcus sp. EFPC2]QSA95503.1 thiamine phosphate synthase [Methylococcus sp. EFPC2]